MSKTFFISETWSFLSSTMHFVGLGNDRVLPLGFDSKTCCYLG
jgi:hypothetical protein